MYTPAFSCKVHDYVFVSENTKYAAGTPNECDTTTKTYIHIYTTVLSKVCTYGTICPHVHIRLFTCNALERSYQTVYVQRADETRMRPGALYRVVYAVRGHIFFKRKPQIFPQGFRPAVPCEETFHGLWKPCLAFRR